MTCGYTTSAGITLLREDVAVAVPVWELVGGVIDMPQFSFSTPTGTCDDFDSAVDGFEEFFKSGRITMPEMPMLIGMIDGNPVHEKIYEDARQIGDDPAALGRKEKVNFRIVIPTASLYTIEFAALVTSWGLNFVKPSSDDNKITTPITLRPSGGFTRVT